MKSADEILITNYLSGEEESFNILVGRYLKPIYSFIYRYIGRQEEAEDITQDVFLRVWRNLKKFDRKKSFKTWIFSIAKNASIDFLRKKKSIPFSEFENEKGENTIIEKIASPALLPDEIFERKNIVQILTSAMEKLSLNYRLVLFLRYNDHFTFREIAESLDKPINTVTSQHRRALIKLKKILKKL
jgi:RNA polymerase sigma-70 factor (ECF subfamily)